MKRTLQFSRNTRLVSNEFNKADIDCFQEDKKARKTTRTNTTLVYMKRRM